MCGYGATKCAGLVRQNVRMWCDKMWWVWYDEMCVFGSAKYADIMRSAGMMRRSAAMVRRKGDEMAITSDDRSTRSNYICDQLWFLFIKTAFQEVALICTIKTETKCKSSLKCCDCDKTRFLSLQKGSMVSVIVASASPSNNRFINKRNVWCTIVPFNGEYPPLQKSYDVVLR